MTAPQAPPSEPSYAELTRGDPNPLKRAVQARRLADALRLARDLTPRVILDYGGGDGALLKAAGRAWPQAQLVCFEPAPQLAAQARDLLADMPKASIIEGEDDIPAGVADLVFCTEVFEHLPPAETNRALTEIARALVPGGHALIGVPIELGPPALAKGLFRAVRRPGDFDALPATIFAAATGRPPAPRPLSEISPGRAYYPHHAGFDHRRLLSAVAERFSIEKQAGSPFAVLPLWINSELYVRLRKGR